MSLTLATHEFGHSLPHLGWIVNNFDAVSLQTSDLRLSVTLTTSDNGTGVTHSSTRRRGLTRNKTDDWQIALIICAEPFSSLFLCFSSDFSNHDDTFRLGIVNKTREDIDEVCSVEWVTSNADYS